MLLPLINLELNFHPNETQFPSTDNFKLITNNKYPVYYDIDKDYNSMYISYTYQINYIINCSYGLIHGLMPRNSRISGYHEIDREYIRILINKKTTKPEIVYFSAHDKEGKWIPWENCEKNKNGDLKIYPAYCSHANYPYSGTWFRVCFLGNDRCSSLGKIIIPELINKKIILDISPDRYKNGCLLGRLGSYLIY